MKITPAILPHELLIIIDQSISPEDRFACMFVSRQWNTVFSRLFYKSVTIQSLRACIKFHRTLCESVKLHAQPIGHVVKSLRFRQHSPPPAVMRNIPTLCPSLLHFEFCDMEDQLVSYCKDTLDPDAVHEPMLIPDRASMSQLLHSHYRKLALDHLSLECSGVKSIRFLLALPQLSSLSLNWNGIWRTEDMDVIHSVCPKLEAIQIKALSLESGGMDITTSNEVTTVPATRVKKVQLTTESNESATGFPLWMIYFSRKYPNLEELSLCRVLDTELVYSVFPEDRDPYNELFFDDAWTMRTAREEIRKEAYRLFLKSCPRLKSLQLINMECYEYLLKELVARREHKINLMHFSMHYGSHFPVRNFSLVMHTFRNTLVSLSLLFKGSDNETVWQRTSLNVALLVSQLPQLEYLTIGEMHHLSLTAILDKAPRLKSFTMIHPRLSLASEDQDEYLVINAANNLHNVSENLAPNLQCFDDAQHSLLETLILKSTPLCQKLLDHIARRCPQLKYFALEDCRIYDAPKGYTVIDLSQQHLQTLKLDNLAFKYDHGLLPDPSVEEFNARICALQLMSESSRTLWYDTDVVTKEHRTSANDAVIGIRPLDRKQVPALMAQFTTLGRSLVQLEQLPCVGIVHIQCQTVGEFWANGMRLLKNSGL